MSLINWIFDIYQHTRIESAHEEAQLARAELAAMRGSGGSIDGERLQRALEEMALATKTIQRVLVEKGVCSSDELGAMLRKIDGEDGRLDGRSPL